MKNNKTKYGSSYESMLKKFKNTEFPLPISMAAQEVVDGSKVLEFGCSSGYLTRYLSEEKNCDMYINEIDEDAAISAQKYAVLSDISDAENYNWLELFGCIKFDFIIFTDVLEHVKDPWTLLAKATSLLKNNGKLLISLPNISYKTVLIDLIKYDQFEYASSGILDHTHLRFFTQKSAIELIESAGLKVEKLRPYKKKVVSGEKDLKEIPFLMRKFLLKSNPNIDTSVYFFVAKKSH